MPRNPTDAVRRFLQRQKIRDAAVCCALSGGADSICLLVCLLAVQAEFGLRLSAVHIQHNLRGEESQRDEEFCRSFCHARSVPLTVIPVDVRQYAAAHSLSIETAARECRYAAFRSVPCDYLATAHTASDQLETVLFRLARGTGLRGLCGIPPVREHFIRPLLDVTRTEIEAELRLRQITFVTDSSNLTDAFTRNRIRRHIVPELAAIHSGTERNIIRMTELLRADADFLETAAQTAYREHLQPDGSLYGPAQLHPALQSRCIARFLEENGFPHGFEAVAAVQQLLHCGGQCDLDRSGKRIRYSRGLLYVADGKLLPDEISLQIGENVLFPGISVTAELVERTNSEKFSSVHKKFTDFVLDYDIIIGYAKLHARKPGLRFLPACRSHHISVKKWLNADVPPAKRQHIHFLSDELGLIWVEGLGAAQRVRVTPETRRMLVLRIHPTNT